MCVCVCVCVCVFVCVFGKSVCVCACVHACVYTCMHAFMVDEKSHNCTRTCVPCAEGLVLNLAQKQSIVPSAPPVTCLDS